GRHAIRLAPVAVGAARLSGLITGPELTRPSRGELTFVVNGRWVQAPRLLEALETGYRPLLSRGRHPLGLVRIGAPPDAGDATVPPAKREVPLRDERALAAALAEAVAAALGPRARPAPRLLQLPRLLDGLGGDFAPIGPAGRVAEAPPAWDEGEETFG